MKRRFGVFSITFVLIPGVFCQRPLLVPSLPTTLSSLASPTCNTNADCRAGEVCTSPFQGLVNSQLGTLLSGLQGLVPAFKHCSPMTSQASTPSATQSGEFLSGSGSRTSSIVCRNITAVVSFEDSITVNVEGQQNDLFSIIGSVGASEASVTELSTGQKVPGSFSFSCDLSGTVSLRFQIVTSAAVKVCPAQIVCLPGTITPTSRPRVDVSGSPVEIVSAPETTRTPLTSSATLKATRNSQQPAIRISCLNFETVVKAERSVSLSLADSVYSIQPAPGVTLKTISIRDVSTNAEMAGATILRCPKSKNGTQVLSFKYAVAASTLEGDIELQVCPVVLHCVQNRAPEIKCAEETPVVSGSIGQPLIYQLPAGGSLGPFFNLDDPDGDPVDLAFQDALTGEIMWDVSHTCTTPSSESKTVYISAYDGQNRVANSCPIKFDCKSSSRTESTPLEIQRISSSNS